MIMITIIITKTVGVIIMTGETILMMVKNQLMKAIHLLIGTRTSSRLIRTQFPPRQRFRFPRWHFAPVENAFRSGNCVPTVPTTSCRNLPNWVELSDGESCPLVFTRLDHREHCHRWQALWNGISAGFLSERHSLKTLLSSVLFPCAPVFTGSREN